MPPAPDQPPIDRTIQLVTMMRETASRLQSELTEAIAERDRLKSHASLRRREEGAKHIKESEDAVKHAKEDLRHRRRLIEDQKTNRLKKLQQQYAEREGEIDEEAAHAGKAAARSMENEEWMAEGLYEGRVTAARKKLSETLTRYGDIEDLIEAIRARIPRSSNSDPEKIPDMTEEIDPDEIMTALQELDRVHTAPRWKWAMFWKWAAHAVVCWRRSRQDLELMVHEADETYDGCEFGTFFQTT